MALRTFRESCSFAGIATLLEARGMRSGDREVCRDARVPWVWQADDDGYYVGSWLSNAPRLNHALAPHGLHLEETLGSPNHVLAALRRAPGPALVSIQSGPQGHTVVAHPNGGGWWLQNMRFEHEEPDGWQVDEDGLRARLREQGGIGWLADGPGETSDLAAEHRATIDDVLPRWRADVVRFWESRPDRDRLRASLNPLLRIFLEGRGLMQIAGDDALADDLEAVFQRLKPQLGAPESDLTRVASTADVAALADRLRATLADLPA